VRSFNRLTSLICSLVGMTFLGSGLLAGLWAGTDGIGLIRKVFFSGLTGAGLGYVVGRFFTLQLNELAKTKLAQEEAGVTRPEPELEEEKTANEFQAWNPPRIDRDQNQGG
jgi:hypothetical protein